MTIVRPHHPLRGRRYDVLKGGKQQLTIRLDDGTSMNVPRSWTDVDGPVAPRRREEILTVDALRRLTALIEAYMERLQQ